MKTSTIASVALLTSVGAFASPLSFSNFCHEHEYPGPDNADFETGDLSGWTVLEGNAFGPGAVTHDTTWPQGIFNQDKKNFYWGYAAAGDGGTGRLKSSSFQASSVMSFLIGGGWDPENLYVALVLESNGNNVLKQTGMDDESLIRITWDTRPWAGQMVHLIVVDNATGGWGHINLDDVRTGCSALTQNNQSFHILGQANQPSAYSGDACTRFGVDPFRPQYHYTAYQGWINDPCGLIQWAGTHHRFAQFHPDSPFGGPISWSHASSSDGVHWKELPVALQAPYVSNPNDGSGRWTGSAVKNTDGSLRLVFTEETDGNWHSGSVNQNVWTATSQDGVTFSYSQENPVVPMPPQSSKNGFRDPKVFLDPNDNIWKMVVGSGADGMGQIQLYKTHDLQSWEYVGIAHEAAIGDMWECPNLFPLDGRWVLFYGAFGQGLYEVGSFDGTRFTSEMKGRLDAGPHAYAAQWYVDEAGRNLLVTWMYSFSTSKQPSRVNGWVGQHSFTRELFIRADGGLGSRPGREIELLASSQSELHRDFSLIKEQIIGHGTVGRLQISIDLGSTSAHSFTISLFSSETESVDVTFTLSTRTLVLDTRRSGYGDMGTWSAVIDTAATKQVLGLDILLDNSIIEVYASDGTVFGALVYPRYQDSAELRLVPSDGGSVHVNSAKFTPLSSGWCPATKNILFTDNFNDGTMTNWNVFDGTYDASSKAFVTGNSPSSKALIKINDFTDFVYEADIIFPTDTEGNAGLIFRVTNPSAGADSYTGYYAGIDASGSSILGRANYSWEPIQFTQGHKKNAGQPFHILVRANGDLLSIYVDDMETPTIKARDSAYSRGLNGVRTYQTGAIFDNIQISPITTGPDYYSYGCHAEGNGHRALSGPFLFDDSAMTYELCAKFCIDIHGYSLFGMEFGRECYCGNELSSDCGPASGCDMVCSGNKKQICGGVNRLNLFGHPPKTYRPYGCYTEGDGHRALDGAVLFDDNFMTYDMCAKYCIDTHGFSLFGVEFGRECYCGNELTSGSSLTSSGCDMSCTGNSEQTCGGSNRLSLFGKF